MFFILSKISWALLAPANVMLMLLVVATIALVWRPRWRVARWLAAVSAVVILAGGSLPIGYLLQRALEDRFPRPVALPARVDGIVVLGGAVQPDLAVARGVVALNDTAERMTEAVALSRRYPGARLIFTGGSARLLPNGNTEAATAKRFFIGQGLAEDRVEYEAQSRNTYENARYTYDLVKPRPGETWLLVTSARHMPRSMGCFRQVGWGSILPWPVDYTTKPDLDLVPWANLVIGLVDLNDGLHEWIGLAAYRLSGYSSEWFPGPR